MKDNLMQCSSYRAEFLEEDKEGVEESLTPHIVDDLTRVDDVRKHDPGEEECSTESYAGYRARAAERQREGERKEKDRDKE